MNVKKLLLVSTLMVSTMAAECPEWGASTAPEESEDVTYSVPITFVNEASTSVNIEWPQGLSYVDGHGNETLTIWETGMGQAWAFNIRPSSKWGGAIDVNAHCRYNGGSHVRVVYQRNRARCIGW